MSKTINKKKKCIYCEKTYLSNENQQSQENNEPTMITEFKPNKSKNDYYYIFDNCTHEICIYCIGRLLFTNYLNILPSKTNITLNCKCNEGNLYLNIKEIQNISNKINTKTIEKQCSKHNLNVIEYCLDCKIWLCKKCQESHSDLFSNHHLSKDEPPNNDTCISHPNCFLDRFCKDCHKLICHLCLIEGNEHFNHSNISFDDLKMKIIKNVDNMKFNNFDEFNTFLNEIDNKYKNQYDKTINSFNEQITQLIEIINKAKKDFLANLSEKLRYKNILIQIIKNLYQFFYKEYSTITKSVDYPILCMYQIMNCELINIELYYPKETKSYLSTIINEINKIDDSFLYNTKYLFSLKNFTYKKELLKHTNVINSLCLLKDGRLVSGSEDKTIIIWNKELTKPDHIIKDNNFPIKTLKLLNDMRLISGSYKEMKIYNDSFKCINVLKDISNNICDIINLDDGRIVCGSYREMRIFNMQWNNLYKESQPIKNHTSWVTSLIKLNNKLFASGGDDKHIFIYDNNVKCIRNINFKNEISVLCKILNDNTDIDDYNSFLIGDNNGRIYKYFYNSETFDLISDIDYHDSKINSIIHLFGGNYASCSGNKIIIRDNTFSPIQTFNKDNNKNINCLIQTLNGILCSGGDDFNIQLYE